MNEVKYIPAEHWTVLYVHLHSGSQHKHFDIYSLNIKMQSFATFPQIVTANELFDAY